MQVFEHKIENLTLIVIGAHFPHGQFGILPSRIKKLTDSSGVDKVLLIADTNVQAPGDYGGPDFALSSKSLFRKLGVPHWRWTQSTALLDSCCLNDGFTHQFDRVIANFGKQMMTEMIFDPHPAWAVGEFHKAVIGFLQLLVPYPANHTNHTRDMQDMD